MRFGDIIRCVEARGALFLLEGLTGVETSTRGRGGGQLKVNIDEAATEMQYAYTTQRLQMFTNSKHHKSAQVTLTMTDSPYPTLTSKQRFLSAAHKHAKWDALVSALS